MENSKLFSTRFVAFFYVREATGIRLWAGLADRGVRVDGGTRINNDKVEVNWTCSLSFGV